MGIISAAISSVLFKYDGTITLGEVLTLGLALAGLIIALGQYNDTKKQNWFLNVIVLPQLEPIKEFYIKLLKDLDADKESLISCNTNGHQEKLLEIARKKNEYIRQINNFYDHLGYLVKSYNFELGQKVDNMATELQDDVVRIIDAICDGQDIKVRAAILQNENKLISTLTKEMTK